MFIINGEGTPRENYRNYILQKKLDKVIKFILPLVLLALVLLIIV